MTPDDAEVSVDGRPIEGTGSSRVLELDPGRHRLTLSARGFVSRTEEIAVLSGQLEARTFALQAMPAHPATLVVDGGDGAVITLDGEELGLGHVEREVAAGDHDLDVQAPGREAFHRRITLAVGERVWIDARGESGSGSIADEPLFWVGLVGGAAVVAGTIVLVVVLTQPGDPLAGYDGSTGVVLAPLVRF